MNHLGLLLSSSMILVAGGQESWAKRFPDSELNHYSGGFRLVFDRPDDIRWKPRMRRSPEIPDLGLYLPLKARYTAILTAKGAKFEPPPWW